MLFVSSSNSNNTFQGNIIFTAFPSHKTNPGLIAYFLLNKEKLVNISESLNRFETCNSVQVYLKFLREKHGKYLHQYFLCQILINCFSSVCAHILLKHIWKIVKIFRITVFPLLMNHCKQYQICY